MVYRVKMRSQKLKFMLVTTCLLAVCWLGYWIGYVSRSESAGQSVMELQKRMGGGYNHAVQLKNQNGDHIHIIKDTKRQEPVIGKLTSMQNQRQSAVHSQVIDDKQTKVHPPTHNEIPLIKSALGNADNNQQLKSVQDNINHLNQKAIDSFQDSGSVHSKSRYKENRRPGPVETVDNGKNINELRNIHSRESVHRPNNYSSNIETIHKNEKSSGKFQKDEMQHLYKNSLQDIPAHLRPAIIAQEEKASPKQGQPFYTMLHSGKASQVKGTIHASLKAMPENTMDSHAYVLQDKRIPKEVHLRPNIGNGYLATMIHSERIHMSGMYNGFANESSRAEIPSTVSFNITGTEPAANFSRKCRLNVGEGIYSEQSISSSYNVTQRFYVHRTILPLLVVEVDLVMRGKYQPIKLKLDLKVKFKASYDYTFHSEDSNMEEVSYKVGRQNSPEKLGGKPAVVHVLYDHIPDSLTPPTGSRRTKWVFLSAMGRSQKEVLKAYQEGAKLIHSSDALYASHVQAWSQLWGEGRVDIVGNRTLARAAYSSLYYILSSIPYGNDSISVPFPGVSPHGLPLGHFLDSTRDHGSVMWEQEMWILPAVLPLHPSLARRMLQGRIAGMPGARANSNATHRRGLLYPWMAAASGEDVAVLKDPFRLPAFVSGCVSQAALQYLRATNDTGAITMGQLGSMVDDIATFYISMLSIHKKQKSEIADVQPPDIGQRNVQNSVFVNAIANLSIHAVREVYAAVNQKRDIGSFPMYIPYDSNHQYHPASDSYQPGAHVYQSEAVMLGYPLQYVMPIEARRNDLLIYERVLDDTVSPTVWAAHAIGWLELKHTEAARRALDHLCRGIRNKFYVWSDTVMPNKKSGNYLSAAGAFLQTLLNGFGGIRIRADRFDVDPVLPPGVKTMHFSSIDYLGSTLDITAHSNEVIVILKAVKTMSPKLSVFRYKTESTYSLLLGKPIPLPLGKFALFRTNFPL